MEEIITKAPLLTIPFNRNLLSTPYPGDNSEFLLSLILMMENLILRKEFKKFPNTIQKLLKKIEEIRGLYERAKDKEREHKKEKGVSPLAPFYRIRLDSPIRRAISERLREKSCLFSKRRKNHKNDKI